MRQKEERKARKEEEKKLCRSSLMNVNFNCRVLTRRILYFDIYLLGKTFCAVDDKHDVPCSDIVFLIISKYVFS